MTAPEPLQTPEPHRAAEPRPWNRGDRWALAALVAGALLSLPWVLHGFLDTSPPDATLYLICARSLAAGEGYAVDGVPLVSRPPGFAAALALCLRLFGEDWVALNAVAALSGVASVALLFVLVRPWAGAAVAFAFALSLWINPTFVRLSSQLMSDVPGLALLLAALVLERRARERGTVRADLAVALVLAAGIWVRTLNALLVPAVCLARLVDRLRGRPRRVALVGVVSLALFAPWVVRNASVTESAEPSETVFVHSYWTGMFHEDAGDPSSARLGPADLLARVPERARQVFPLLGSRLTHRGLGTFAGILGGVFVLVWAVRLYRRTGPEEVFVGLLLLVLLTYFGFRARLVLPLYVLVVPMVLAALARYLDGPARGHGGLWVAPLVLAVAGADAAAPSWSKGVELRWQSLVAVTEDLRAREPKSVALLYAPGLRAVFDGSITDLGVVAARHGPAEAIGRLERGEVELVVSFGENRLVRRLQKRAKLEAIHGRYRLWSASAAPPAPGEEPSD